MSTQRLLIVRDVSTSITFYTHFLGFKIEGEPLLTKQGKPCSAMVKSRTMCLRLSDADYHQVAHGFPHTSGIDHYFLLADDLNIEILYERIQASGVTIIQKLGRQFWGDKCFVIQDPDGYRIALAQNVQTVSPNAMSDHTGKY